MSKRLKNTVLLLLCISTVVLFGLNLTIALDSSRFMNVKKSLGIGTAAEGLADEEVIVPAKIGITGPGGLRLADGRDLYDTFSELNPVISEAFGSVSRIWSISKKDFCDRLSRQGIYLSFTFPVPFYMLQYWWTGETGFSSEQSAETVLLTVADGESVELAFYDGRSGGFYAAETAAGYERMTDICRTADTANGVFAAFSDGSYMLKPWEPVRRDTVIYPTYYAVPMDFTAEGAITQELLSAFSINPFLAKEYKTVNGDIVYVEGYTALQFSKNGSVVYSSNEEQGIRLSSPDVTSRKEEDAYMAKSVRRLLSSIYSAGSLKCQLSIADIKSRSEGDYVISFERMAGGAFITEDNGYTAVVSIENGIVTEIKLWMKTLTASGEKNMLPFRLMQSLLKGDDLSIFIRHTEKDGILTPGVYAVKGGAYNGLE